MRSRKSNGLILKKVSVGYGTSSLALGNVIARLLVADRYCPPDKTVFGVPLLLSLQRNGQALPKCIQTALRWLRSNALDEVGLFRKSGVRSRIQKLKTMTKSQGDTISYEGQQAYDVANMVKQYFRELPEALLTNKLSETFIAIFQRRHPSVGQEDNYITDYIPR